VQGRIEGKIGKMDNRRAPPGAFWFFLCVVGFAIDVIKGGDIPGPGLGRREGLNQIFTRFYIHQKPPQGMVNGLSWRSSPLAVDYRAHARGRIGRTPTNKKRNGLVVPEFSKFFGLPILIAAEWV